MVTKDLGMVTAYAYAVSKGYTGTEEEFAELMASYASVAQDAVDAALAAAQSAQSAQSAQAAAEGAKDTAQATVSGAIAGIQAEGQTQVGAVQSEGTVQVGNVNSAGQTQLGNVNAAGATQVGNVNTAGSTQVSAIQAKGNQIIASLPDDFTEIQGQVTQLSDEIDERFAYLLSLHFDGTRATYNKLMKQFFDAKGANTATPAELTAICEQWYEGIRGDWNGSTEFYQPSVSDVSTGTKTGDNAGKVCEPSTDAVAGRDDYAGLGLFACTDVNWQIDATTLDVVITGVDGITDSFERTNPDKLVGVMQMSGWHWRDEDEQVFVEGYAEQEQTGHDYCAPVPEAVRVDGTMRQFVVHAKYMGKMVGNKMRCYAGVAPTAFQSHNTLQTNCRANGSQYGGGSVLLNSWLILMTRIKYASLTLDGIIDGCFSHSAQYYASAPETGVKRVLLKSAEAANLPVGSAVMIGNVPSGGSVDRGNAAIYAVSGRDGVIVTAHENVTVDGVDLVAVCVDTDEVFNTVGDGTKAEGHTVISTCSWPTGTNDAVLGNDGNIVSNHGAKYPAKLQGIEFATGTYEVFGDVILAIDAPGDGHEYGTYTYYVVDEAVKQATSITADYRDVGIVYDKTGTAGWKYISKMGFANGVYTPEDVDGGSSTKYTRDAFYENADVTSRTLREWLAFALLHIGSGTGGLSCLIGNHAVSIAYWYIGGRPSACANRGVWGVSHQNNG